MRRLTWIMVVLSVVGSGCASGTVGGESTLADDFLSSTEAIETDTTSTVETETTSTSTSSTMLASSEPPVDVLSPFTEDSLRPGEQEAFVHVSEGGIEMDYLLYLPDGHDPNRSWPVILSLHGFLGFEDQTISSVRDWNPWFDGHRLELRIGINSGPVVAGIIGTHKFAYDLSGDTANTASQMESGGIAGQIQVTPPPTGSSPATATPSKPWAPSTSKAKARWTPG